MAISSYDTLYENMKTRFTVVSGDNEYTLGDYMIMKANKKQEEAKLPVAMRSTAGKGERAVAQIISFVNDKLTIKQPPVKDKTIRAFPFRASSAAFLSAVVACSFVLCFSIIGARILNLTSSNISEASITEYAPEIEEEITTAYNI